MTRSRFTAFRHHAAWTALLVAACSKGGTPAAAQSGGATAAPAKASLGSACKRQLLTSDDVGAVLRAPSTAAEIPGDNGSTCSFTTAGYASLTVTLRPGMGKTTLAIWKSGKMPVSGVAEQGVGDEAMWVDGTHEVVARKNDLLCDIQVSGLDRNAPGTSIADQRRGAGALCNKIFAAVQ
jgi:hypothetical protein